MPYIRPKGMQDEKKRMKNGISLKESPIHKYRHLKEKKKDGSYSINRWSVPEIQTICFVYIDRSLQNYRCDAPDI